MMFRREQSKWLPQASALGALLLSTLLLSTLLLSTLLLSTLLLSAWLGGCSRADTLGGEKPDEVKVGSPPTWNNGMKDLLALKCAACHQSPPPKSAPDGIPDGLDFRFQHGSGETDGAVDTLDSIKSVVQQGIMPPTFATPLTDQEKQAILDWDGS
jgi:uncharacterized membrane protein